MMEDIFDINYSFSHFFIFKDFVIPYFYFTSSVICPKAWQIEHQGIF